MLDGPNLSGQLADWSINDLLQIMQVTKKTGSLDINGERRGRIHFVDGSVTGAELSGDQGNHEGTDRGAIADIIYVLSTLESGTFGVGAADGPHGDGLSVEDLLDEVAVLRSIEAEVVDAGLVEAAGVRLVGDLEAGITLEPPDWQVLVSLVQPFTFAGLEASIGRSGAVRILHTLNRLGVVETIEGQDDDESEWLDRVAGGLAVDSSQPTWIEQVAEESTAKHIAPEPDIIPVAESVDREPETEPEPDRPREPARGLVADASTTLTDGVYDEIRRLRSKVADK